MAVWNCSPLFAKYSHEYYDFLTVHADNKIRLLFYFKDIFIFESCSALLRNSPLSGTLTLWGTSHPFFTPQNTMPAVKQAAEHYWAEYFTFQETKNLHQIAFPAVEQFQKLSWSLMSQVFTSHILVLSCKILSSKWLPGGKKSTEHDSPERNSHPEHFLRNKTFSRTCFGGVIY